MAMTFEVITLFPGMFSSVLSASLLGRAIEQGTFAVHSTDPRDFPIGPRPSTAEGRRQIDDTPYGGGAGMVMRAEPIASAIDDAQRRRGAAHKVLLCPSGAPLHQS